MNRGLNKVIFIGSLGKDPEMRYTPAGKPVSTFPIVIERNWTTTEGEKREDIEIFNIIAWGQLAEFCNSQLKKNFDVYIEGRLQTRRWENKDGTKISSAEIVANEIIILNEKKNKTYTSDSSSNEKQNDD